MRRFFSAMLLTAAVLAMPAPAAAGAIGAFCNYDAGQHQVTIDLIGQQTAIRVSRDAQGRIQLKGVWCDGEATVSNTDSIVMSGDDAFHEIQIVLANGGFKPGFTNEPGTSDEIEFAIDIGVYSIVGIDGTAGNQKIDFGQGAGALAGVSRINLNAGETTGIDSDVSITNVSSLWVDGNAGSDRIRAQGDKDRPRSAGAAGRYIRWIRQ